MVRFVRCTLGFLSVVVVVVVVVVVAVAVAGAVAGGRRRGGGGGGAGASTSATLQGRPEDSSYDRHYTRWAKIWMMVAGGVNLELTPHHQANARFLSEDGFSLWPSDGQGSRCYRGLDYGKVGCGH